MLETLSRIVLTGDVEQLKVTIQNIKSANRRWTWQNNNPLIIGAARDAILQSSLAKVEVFLNEGINPNAKALLGTSLKPLIEFAVKIDSLPIVQLLVDKGAKVKDTRMFSTEEDNQDGMRAAIDDGKTQIIQYLLQQGANANGTYFSQDRFKPTMTFLGKAALRRDTDTVKLLIQHGADKEAALESLRSSQSQEDYNKAASLLSEFPQGFDGLISKQ